MNMYNSFTCTFTKSNTFTHTYTHTNTSTNTNTHTNNPLTEMQWFKGFTKEVCHNCNMIFGILDGIKQLINPSTLPSSNPAREKSLNENCISDGYIFLLVFENII